MFSRSIKSICYIIVVIASLFVLCVSVSLAEEKADESIFKYKKQLAISDKQEKNLRNILSKLQNYLIEKQKELDVLRNDLNKLIVEKSDINKIRAKLHSIARIQADASCEDIISVRAIEKELTEEQMAKWRGIQEEYRKKLQEAQAAALKAAGNNK